MDESNCMPPQKQDESSLLTAIVSGFVAGVTATITLFSIFKKG